MSFLLSTFVALGVLSWDAGPVAIILALLGFTAAGFVLGVLAYFHFMWLNGAFEKEEPYQPFLS
jgi:hypothetical protein